MMAKKKRVAINKKLRFEVFDRDNFTCQYCGKTPPDVVLHVDHIKPVKEGGDNSLSNLITSCSDCNRGKGSTPLRSPINETSRIRMLQELAEVQEAEDILKRHNVHMQNILDLICERICTYTRKSFCKRQNCVGIFNVMREFSAEQCIDWLDTAGCNLCRTESFSGKSFGETDLVKYFYGIVKKHREQLQNEDNECGQ
jgi:hypothetical protein